MLFQRQRILSNVSQLHRARGIDVLTATSRARFNLLLNLRFSLSPISSRHPTYGYSGIYVNVEARRWDNTRSNYSECFDQTRLNQHIAFAPGAPNVVYTFPSSTGTRWLCTPPLPSLQYLSKWTLAPSTLRTTW